jgi:RNA polymerase sigma factor for flagellar operon FliA
VVAVPVQAIASTRASTDVADVLVAAPTPRRRITEGPLSAEDTRALWLEYHATGDPALRDRLVLTFAPLVKYIVYRKVREIPQHCEVEDFISCGLEALIQSVERYDPDRGATLEQFAWTRIHGAVLDELRRHDWAPRRLRRWEREIGRSRDAFLNRQGRRPSDDELAGELGISPRDLRRKEDELALCDVSSLNALISGDDQGVIERIDTLASDRAESDPERAAIGEAAKTRFREVFATLPAREREVVVLLYVDNLTLREIGEVLGVSESRVCQIHGQLKRTLRTALQSEAALFADAA